MHKQTLSNDLTILVEESHTAPLAAVQAWVAFGSAAENEKTAGVAHCIEHMLFKGSRHHGPGELARRVEAAGGVINAWTSFDETVFHLAVPKNKLSVALDVLADAVLHPRFAAADLKSERDVILEEISQGDDDAGHQCVERLFDRAFAPHPYHRPIIGFRSTVAALTHRDLKKIHRRHYAPHNITIVVTGDVDAKRVFRLVKNRMGGAKKRAKNESPPKFAVQHKLRTTCAKTHTGEVHLTLGFHIPGLAHPDTAALDVLAVILGQGESSRLYNALHRKRQLVNEIYAYAFTPKNLGLLVVGASLAPENFKAAFDAVMEMLFRAAVEEVTNEELQKAVRMLTSEAVYGAETVQGLARKLGFFHTLTGDPEYDRQYLAAVRRLTPAAVRKTVTKYLTPQNLTVSLVGPRKDTKGRKQALPALLRRPSRQIQTHIRKRVTRAHTAQTPPKRAPGLKRMHGNIYRQQTAAGARFLVLPDHSVPLVSFRAVWLGGLRVESTRNNGIANLLAGMFTRGTKKMSGDDCVRAIEAMGGSLSGVAGRNTIGLRADVLSHHWREGLALIMDCITQPRLAAAELDKEKQNVLGEIQAMQDNLTAVVFQFFRKALFGPHPYGMSLLGTSRSIPQITPAQIKSHHRRFCRPQDLVLAVVGDVDPDRVAATVGDILDQLSSRPRKHKYPKVPAAPVIEQPIRTNIKKRRKQAHIVLGFRGVAADDPNRFATEMLTAVLSGQRGRLFTGLRDALGLAYQVNATTIEGIDPGYLAVYIATMPEKIDQAIAGIRNELDRLRCHKVGKRELDEVKNHLVGSHAISLQRRNALASSLALNEIYGLGCAEHLDYEKKVMRVTSTDIREAARRYLDPRSEVLAILAPQ